MSLSRRHFLVAVPVAGTVFALAPSLAIRMPPVLSFHLDRPYVDLTGREKPYIPPVGMRSGAPLASLSDEALARFYGFI